MAAFLSSVFADSKAVMLSQMECSQITQEQHWKVRDWEATNAALQKTSETCSLAGTHPQQIDLVGTEVRSWGSQCPFSAEEHRRELIKPKMQEEKEASSIITTGTAGHLPSQHNSCCLHMCKWLEIRTDKLRHLVFLDTAFTTLSKWKMCLIMPYN